jgi:hypothetical protein
MILFLIPAALLLLAMADMPGGYYVFMRIVVCLISSFAAIASYKIKDSVNLGTVVFGAMAILFNPIIPVYLYDRDIWIPIDIIGAIIFVVGGLYFNPKSK